jgi:hypothetical protein
MVPFEAPPVTLHVTAVFEVPVTVTVNCCVFPTGTLAAVGLIDTAMELLLTLPPQPTTKTRSQLTVPRNERPRMNVLTGGPGTLFQEAGITKRTTPKV